MGSLAKHGRRHRECPNDPATVGVPVFRGVHLTRTTTRCRVADAFREPGFRHGRPQSAWFRCPGFQRDRQHLTYDAWKLGGERGDYLIQRIAVPYCFQGKTGCQDRLPPSSGIIGLLQLGSGAVPYGQYAYPMLEIRSATFCRSPDS